MYSSELGIIKYAFNPNAQEVVVCRPLWVQSQSNLQREFQDSQGYACRPSLQKKRGWGVLQQYSSAFFIFRLLACPEFVELLPPSISESFIIPQRKPMLTSCHHCPHLVLDNTKFTLYSYKFIPMNLSNMSFYISRIICYLVICE